MSNGLALFLTVLLLGGNAFFVGAEFAVITARRDRLETLANEGRSRARTALRGSGQLPLLIAGAQLGVTLCSLGLGALAEPTISDLLADPFTALGVPDAVVNVVSFAIALCIVTMLHTLLGEMVPKNLALAGPERAAMWLVPIHLRFCQLTRPLLNLYTAIASAVLRLIRVTPKSELDSAYTPDELASLIAESRREGLLEGSEHRRLAKTLSSTHRTVADVVVPLAELTMLPTEPTVGDVETLVTQTGFSRFPLRGADGRLAGYLHVKDILDLANGEPSTPVPPSRVRGLPQLPVDARLDEALSALRRANSHLASAVRPDGSTVGVVALEDLVEEYVGTVHDGTHVGSSTLPVDPSEATTAS
ncbi:MAG TPA: hemolysin family protein [Pseudonocardiaceae bacterium]|jgi:CBS domain containing-hemolysin-like protein|nr:hemolysin family protein [Pseudonocardiaceae bacterium]